MLQGLLPTGDRNRSELDQALLDGRYQEIRMLFYVGRDLIRWIDQCMEFVERNPALRGCGIKEQSFAAHLIQQPPADVAAKLRKWGVVDYRSIFGRALGLNALFADIPSRELLTDDFVRNYYRFADQMFQCKQSSATFSEIKDSAASNTKSTLPANTPACSNASGRNSPLDSKKYQARRTRKPYSGLRVRHQQSSLVHRNPSRR